MITILNSTDIDICNHLVGDAKMTMKILGEKVFLSEEAVRKRVKRLEDSGFIVGYHASLNQTNLGSIVSGNNHIKLVHTSGKSIESFMSKSMEIPEIMNCQYVVADGYDFIVIIEASSLIEHNQILSIQLCRDFEVYSIATSFVLSETKGKNGGKFKSYLNNGLNKLLLVIAYCTQLSNIEAAFIGHLQ
jgi:Lrp/AsnC family leucine-responsive transcriptional regulator